MLAALAVQTRSVDWQKDGGRFVPYPATWLNQRRWEDELPTPAAPSRPTNGPPPASALAAAGLV